MSVATAPPDFYGVFLRRNIDAGMSAAAAESLAAIEAGVQEACADLRDAIDRFTSRRPPPASLDRRSRT